PLAPTSPLGTGIPHHTPMTRSRAGRNVATRPAPGRRAPRSTAASGPAKPPAWSRADSIVTILLVVAVAAIYARTGAYPFLNFDDDLYVYRNPEVMRGLTWSGVRWAFTTFHASNWHPLTWLSHMLDAQLFGATMASAGAHHLMSAALHAANGV